MSLITLEFFGKVEAKKNSKTPFVGKDGKMRVANSKKAQDSMNAIMLQVPGEYRDLNLESPDIWFMFTVADGRSDRDNMVSTLLDCLVKMKVLKNDSIARNNGRIIIEPAVISDHYKTVVEIMPRPIPMSESGLRLRAKKGTR